MKAVKDGQNTKARIIVVDDFTRLMTYYQILANTSHRKHKYLFFSFFFTMQTNFTITSKDVEALQLTVPKVQKTNYKGEAYTGYDYLLTDTDRPLDLLCIAY